MPINHQQYELDGLIIEWGKTFSEVALLLDKYEKFKTYGGRSNLRYRCNQVFGLKATELRISAPFEDRPVLQVSYALSPIKPNFFEKLHAPYMKHLGKVLGKPYKSEALYNQFGKKNSGSVIYVASWIFDDIHIGLSVFGDTRAEDSGLSAAGIWIDWKDEIKAAASFRLKNKILEDKLNKLITAEIKFQRFKIKNPQRAYLRSPYDPDAAEKQHELWASQTALYNRELFQTPKIIQDNIEGDEIALYYLPELKKTAVSNKWNTVLISAEDEKSLIYCEILPARGSGGRELRLRELRISDSRESNALLDLVAAIEQGVGVKVQRREAYDD